MGEPPALWCRGALAGILLQSCFPHGECCFSSIYRGNMMVRCSWWQWAEGGVSWAWRAGGKPAVESTLPWQWALCSEDSCAGLCEVIVSVSGIPELSLGWGLSILWCSSPRGAQEQQAYICTLVSVLLWTWSHPQLLKPWSEMLLARKVSSTVNLLMALWILW